MGWKFWEREKSEAELSLERLQSGQTAPAGSATAAGVPAGDEDAQTTNPYAADGSPGDPSFRMRVEDVFMITGRGLVVTGRVDSGTVSAGEQVTLTRTDGSSRRVSVTGIEAFRELLQTATVGQNVGLLLKELKRPDVARGDVLTG